MQPWTTTIILWQKSKQYLGFLIVPVQSFPSTQDEFKILVMKPHMEDRAVPSVIPNSRSSPSIEGTLEIGRQLVHGYLQEICEVIEEENDDSAALYYLAVPGFSDAALEPLLF